MARTDWGVPVGDEEVGEAIAKLERSLLEDDPSLARRFDGLCRADTVAVLSVFALLAVGAVLLTVAMATLWLPGWLLGSGSCCASVLVDWHHRRALQRVR